MVIIMFYRRTWMGHLYHSKLLNNQRVPDHYGCPIVLVRLRKSSENEPGNGLDCYSAYFGHILYWCWICMDMLGWIRTKPWLPLPLLLEYPRGQEWDPRDESSWKLTPLELSKVGIPKVADGVFWADKKWCFLKYGDESKPCKTDI